MYWRGIVRQVFSPVQGSARDVPWWSKRWLSRSQYVFKNDWFFFRCMKIIFDEIIASLVGDTLALSVSTPKHLEKIGLLTGYNATDTGKSAVSEYLFFHVSALDNFFFVDFLFKKKQTQVWYFVVKKQRRT